MKAGLKGERWWERAERRGINLEIEAAASVTRIREMNIVFKVSSGLDICFSSLLGDFGTNGSLFLEEFIRGIDVGLLSDFFHTQC